jgi:hypothetical protein
MIAVQSCILRYEDAEIPLELKQCELEMESMRGKMLHYILAGSERRCMFCLTVPGDEDVQLECTHKIRIPFTGRVLFFSHMFFMLLLLDFFDIDIMSSQFCPYHASAHKVLQDDLEGMLKISLGRNHTFLQ